MTQFNKYVSITQLFNSKDTFIAGDSCDDGVRITEISIIYMKVEMCRLYRGFYWNCKYKFQPDYLFYFQKGTNYRIIL